MVYKKLECEKKSFRGLKNFQQIVLKNKGPEKMFSLKMLHAGNWTTIDRPFDIPVLPLDRLGAFYITSH